jgi:hypothetical protein
MKKSDDSQVKAFVNSGDLLGYLWSHDMLMESVL